MTFEMVSTFFVVIGIIGGFIITVTGAITGLVKIKDMMSKSGKAKMDSMRETLKIHTQEISSIKEDINVLKQVSAENKEMSILICKGVKCLMDNSITGNGIENLKKTRKELDDYLIEKK